MNTRQCVLRLVACACLLMPIARLFAADVGVGNGPASKEKQSSLDEELLKGLDNALLEGLEEAPSKTAEGQGRRVIKAGERADTNVDSTDDKSKQPSKVAPHTKKTSSLDDQLLDALGGDGIVAPGREKDALTGIGRRMRNVESRLAAQRLDDQTKEMQQKILDDLGALMQECKKQCQGGGNGKPGSKSGKGSQGSQSGKNPATQAPNDTARNSTDKLRSRTTERGQRGTLVGAMKESWGNLPERARQELSNTNTDVFLPKYELMLEKYFKRLSEADSEK
jgi:hypothetical protein